MAKTKPQSKLGNYSHTSSTSGCMSLCQPLIGVSKLKSQLRQAKRLLQKDGLSSELRQTTQLKITQLAEAIESNPRKEQERRNAIKYHGIKFFDRKKVTRRLKKAITELEQLDSTHKHYKNKKRKLDLEVEQLRIDLNYVKFYPKQLKYVALFPGGEYKNHHQGVAPPLPESIPSSKDADSLRNYVRNYISQSMQSGTLSNTPEAAEQPDVDNENQIKPPILSVENDDFFESVMD